MYLWAIYIFPQSGHLFCCSKRGSQIHECRNWERGSFISGNICFEFAVQRVFSAIQKPELVNSEIVFCILKTDDNELGCICTPLYVHILLPISRSISTIHVLIFFLLQQSGKHDYESRCCCKFSKLYHMFAFPTFQHRDKHVPSVARTP
jgi:hypothetical protein